MYTQKIVDEVITAAKTGKPYTEIARETGIHLCTIRTWAKEHSLPRRRTGSRPGKLTRRPE